MGSQGEDPTFFSQVLGFTDELSTLCKDDSISVGRTPSKFGCSQIFLLFTNTFRLKDYDVVLDLKITTVHESKIQFKNYRNTCKDNEKNTENKINQR